MTPAASVVVPTHNRAALLPRLVRALEAQHVPGGFEVVIVDDASTDATSAELARLSSESSLDLRAISLPSNAGAGAARNAGWRLARADVVAFTDDDCVPAPGWLAALLRGIDGADLVQGCTLADPAGAVVRGPFSRVIEITTETGLYETCNMAYRRDVLEEQQGFDEAFRGDVFGEDLDLAWRAKEAGASSRFVPEAIVYHDVSASRWATHLRSMSRRAGLALAVKKHPALRSRLVAGVFWRPTHPAALTTGLLAAVLASRPDRPTRWVAVATAAGWYAWTCRRHTVRPSRRRDWALVVPASLTADLYETAVLLDASIRHRTLVL